MELRPSLFRFHDEHGHDHEWQTCYASGLLRREQAICVDEFERVQRLTHQTPKANMPTPSAFHFFRGDQCRDEQVYPDIEEWWSDLIGIYQAEIADLYAAGCRYLQLDEVPLAMLCDSDIRQQITDQGQNPDQLTRRYISTINTVLESRPADMTIGIHLCRGNFRSRWMAQGGYEPVADALFNDLNVDAFFLEYDSPRAGGFSPLSMMPADKRVVLGIMTSKSAELEEKSALIGRIEEAAKHVPLDSLSISPQCGFASVAGGNELTEEEQMRKLALVVEVARQVWDDAG
jgi:5-methyltetrahydropteroyltriglutamate--homocysteine methyltransferase